MKVLIAADFLSEYELYETNDIEDLKDITRRFENGENVAPDTTKHKLIGSQDDMLASEARAAADEIIYVCDLIED